MWRSGEGSGRTFPRGPYTALDSGTVEGKTTALGRGTRRWPESSKASAPKMGQLA